MPKLCLRAAHENSPKIDRTSSKRVPFLDGLVARISGIVVRRVTKDGKTLTKYASAHDMRRGCAQRLINAGVSAETLKVIMRHREFSTTERYYGATRSAQAAATEVAPKLAAGCRNSELVGALVGAPDVPLNLSPQQVKKLKGLLNVI